MKKYISCLTVALFATMALATAAGPDKDAIEAKEKAAWQAFKDKKADDFKKIVATSFMGVYSDAIATFQDELTDMQKTDLRSFSLSDYKVVSVGTDSLVTTYKVSMEGTNANGKDMSGTYNAGSVWKKQGANWMAIFHTNVKAETATSPASTP
jgi:ketosteroid isomerase-like protein